MDLEQKTRLLHPVDADFDWGEMYYIGRTILGLSEEEFWECSVEMINELIKIHAKMNGVEDDDKKPKKNKTKKNKPTKEIPIDQCGYF